MAWLSLFLAGIFEVGFAVGLKCSYGFTKLIPSLITLVSMGASLYFLSFTLKTLPLGTTYAIWTGIGTVGTVILGVFLFKESFDITKLICIGLIAVGIIGLKLASSN
ncbi:MAG: multidrug efflux SMR transporter [Clostridium sp.]